MNLYEAIGVRHSVRKYSNKEVSEKLREQLLAFAGKASPLNDRIAVAFEMIDNREKKADIKGLWKVDAPWYLALYSEPAEGFERNGGYLMEQIVLYMTTKGLGTCYLGGRPVKKNGRKAPGYDYSLWLSGGKAVQRKLSGKETSSERAVCL